jgi:hypothetical protein
VFYAAHEAAELLLALLQQLVPEISMKQGTSIWGSHECSYCAKSMLASSCWCRMESVQLARRQRALAAKASLRMRNLCLSSAFEGWRRTVDALQAARGTALRACAKMQSRTLACAFAAWQEWAGVLASARAKAKSVAVRQRRQRIVTAFALWRDTTEDRRRARTVACEQLGKVVALSLHQARFLLGIPSPSMPNAFLQFLAVCNASMAPCASCVAQLHVVKTPCHQHHAYNVMPCTGV